MRFAFVGDLAMGDHPKTVGFGFRSRYSRGIAAEYKHRLLPQSTVVDFMLGNLEFPLGFDATTATTLGALQCRGLDAYAEFLASAGVTALNLANNHSAQHGSEAFHETARAVRRAGMAVVGQPDDFAETGGVTVGRRRVALLGWSQRPRQYAPEVPPYNEFTDGAYAHIREARKRADFVIASIHWGEEFVQLPTATERRVARSMIDAGASLVIGHHPHVLREVEEYGEGLIAYSLGNFVGDMTWNPATRLGGCLLVDMDGPKIRSHQLVLARIKNDYFPTYLSAKDATGAQKWLARQRERQLRGIAHNGYASIARSEHRRHVVATALMMARNAHRYPKGTLMPIFGGALRSRVTG